MEAIHGVTLDLLAETFCKLSDTRVQYGEQQGRVEFERWLASKGLDWNTYALAHNAWQERFNADPTGQLEARFHMNVAQISQRAHFGDVRDMSGDREEGITLDTYAQIVVAISRAGANADDVVRQFGLTDVAHWQRANAAWTAKMGADTTHALTMQYGQLYQKYAGPQFQEEMVQQTAAVLRDAHQPKDVVSEPEEPLTPDLCLRKMQSNSQNERWKYARHYARMADLGNVPDKAWAIAHVTPVLMEIIERHDEHTTSDAEDAARWLWDLGNRSDDFRGSLLMCLNRAREKLATLQAAFAPIQHKAVPERVTLRARMSSYESLVQTMEGYLNEVWQVAAPPPAHFAPPAFHAPSPPPSRGFPTWVLMLLVPLAIGGVFVANRVRHARAMAQVGAATAPAASTPPSAAAAPAAPAPTPAASSAAKKAKRGK